MVTSRPEKIHFAKLEKMVGEMITSDTLVHSVMASMSDPLFSVLKRTPNRHNLAAALAQIEKALRESLHMRKVESDLVKPTATRPVYGWAQWRNGQWYRARHISNNSRGVRVRWGDGSTGNARKFTPYDPQAIAA